MTGRCPSCAYSLKGLPGAHKCPECGLGYDERSTVWRARVPKATWMGLLGFLGGAPTVFQILLNGPMEKREVFPWSYMFVVLYVGAFIGLLVYILRITRRGLPVAATADGVVLRLGRMIPPFIPWSNISHAQYVTVIRGMYGGVALFLKSERKTLDVYGVFKNKREALACADLVNTYVADVGDSWSPCARLFDVRQA